jgi:hypothetical protein
MALSMVLPVYYEEDVLTAFLSKVSLALRKL